MNPHPAMLDARERVTGRVAYTINLERPGMLHAKLLHSTRPHARILAIDTAAARAMPGVKAVVTGADLAARDDISPYFGPIFRDQPIVAIGKVRFVGEPVAAVAAVDADTAQAAIDSITVEYADLPAVFDAHEALEPGAPLVHEQPPRLGAVMGELTISAGEASNRCNHFRLRKGDVEAGFAQADHVFEDTFSSPPVQHVPLETHACIAELEGGRIVVWTTSQIPYLVRGQLAEMFRKPASHVRVIVPTLGGGYGSKCYVRIEPVTVVLAELAGRPVRLQLTREEEFVTVTKHGVTIRMRTGVLADGTIVARQSTCLFNTGAYADIGPRVIMNGGYGTGGPHDIANVAVDSYAVYTNLPPASAFRGFGINQAAWAYDSQLDMIAQRLGMDPYELRRKNLLAEGESMMTGEPLHDAHLTELLDDVAERVGWGDAAPRRASASADTARETPRGRPRGKARGKGLACIIKSTVTPSTSTATAKLNEDGSLNVLTSAVEMGQGILTALAIFAAEPLGLSLDQVSVSTPDTDVTPYDQQTSSSRGTFSMGTAVTRASEHIREQLLDAAAELLEANRADLVIADGIVSVKGSSSAGVRIGEVVRRLRRGNLLGQATFQTAGGLDPETGQGVASVHWHQAAGSAEVEVDLETGKVEVLQYHAAVYAGRVINPVQAELQTEGNVAFGIGQALFEEMHFDGGQLQNGNLGDYMIASFEDMPRTLGVGLLEHPEAGVVHGIGETSLPPVMPAIGNAVFRATGVRITDLPITPEKVLAGLRALTALPGGGPA
jgi:CO/xanthine dehydrogenase Mo-binding subunit